MRYGDKSIGFRATESGPGGHPGVLPPQVGPDGEPVGGPRTPQQIAAQKRLQQTQAQVDEVNGRTLELLMGRNLIETQKNSPTVLLRTPPKIFFAAKFYFRLRVLLIM